MPKPIPVPAATLASYAGKYVFADDQSARSIKVEGDHLIVASAKRSRIAIPSSSSDFLVFDPNDLAEYASLHFSRSPDGHADASLHDEVGTPIGTLRRVR
jgi:hypothetical protein